MNCTRLASVVTRICLATSWSIYRLVTVHQPPQS